MFGPKRVHAAMAMIGYIVSIPVFCDSGFIILSPLNRSLSRQAGLSLAGTSIALSLGLFCTHTMVPPTPGPVAAAGILDADLGLVILIVFHSIAEYLTHPFGVGRIKDIISFIGNPVVALLIGMILSFTLPVKFEKKMLGPNGFVGKALKSAAIIIMITGAGGAFGKVLQNSEMGSILGEMIGDSGLGLWLPFLLAAALKTAQGSSTVAIITTASMIAPLMSPLGFNSELSKAMVVVAIGAGSCVVSHANDSYFWVVTQLSNMNVKQGYKLMSTGSAILGFTAMIILTIMNIFL